MKEIARLNYRPLEAEGRVRIDLTDPLTGRVVDRREGKNHVFTQFLERSYLTKLNSIKTVLTDFTGTLDTTVPFLPGNIIGWGTPSTGSSGNYQGAYNSAGQVIFQYKPTSNSVYWKMVYEFTTSQANGTIGCIGLTYQFDGTNDFYNGKRSLGNYTVGNDSYTNTNDATYGYVVSTAGVITKQNNITFDRTTIDVSATVGTDGNYPKCVCYDSKNGKYGVLVASSSSSYNANNKLYIFSDNSFSTLETVYSVSNCPLDAWYPAYIYNSNLFLVNSDMVYVFDYTTNTLVTTIMQTASEGKNINSSVNNICLYYGCTATGRYLICGQQYYFGMVVDMLAVVKYAVFCRSRSSTNSYTSSIENVNGNERMCINTSDNNYSSAIFDALTAKKLDTPINKTSANGMTVTYELEVSL